MNLSIFKVFAAVLLGSTPSLAKDRPDRSMLHVGNTDFPSPVFNPTPKPTSPCTGNTPGWVDVDGYGCEWWEAVDAPGCPKYGNEFEGSMGTANDNCCYCEGTGAPVVTPSPTPYPTYPPFPTWPPVTYSPTQARDPTPKPTSPCDGSTVNWVDVDGDGCEWYEEYDSEGCPLWGHHFEGTMGVANDNCCYCEGTGAPVATPSPTPYPTYPPTVTMPPSTPFPTCPPFSPFPTMASDPTPKPTSPCTGNTPDWVDVDGLGCEWWEAFDAPGCPHYGDDYEGSMGTANDNCCYCQMD